MGNASFIDVKLQSKSNWYLIARTKLIILFLSERKRNLLIAVASVNTSTTIDLKQLVQLNSTFFLSCYLSYELKTSHLIENCKQMQPSRDVLKKRCSWNMQQVCKRAPMPKCDFSKVAKHLDGCFCIGNGTHRIHSATVKTSVLFTLSKIISKA